MSDFVRMIANNPELAAKTIERLSTEVDELEAENKELREALDYPDIEKLSEAVHRAYCESYFRTHHKPYWTNGDYSKLSEEIKEYDRGTVRTVIFELQQALKGGDK